MIQRIQSLYLLVIVVLSLIIIFLPVAGLQHVQKNELYEIGFQGLKQFNQHEYIRIISTPALSVITVIIPLISFLSIFLYKKRMLQIRLNIVNIILMGGYYVILGIYLWQFAKLLDAKVFLAWVAAFPLVSIILSILAVIAIGKDEALIKSLNRIR